jgi:hypothetical protein
MFENLEQDSIPLPILIMMVPLIYIVPLIF